MASSTRQGPSRRDGEAAGPSQGAARGPAAHDGRSVSGLQFGSSKKTGSYPGHVDHDEVVRLYGPWLPNTPVDAAAFMRGYPGRWWVAVGWAIEAFTNIPRPHGDIDLSVPRSEVPLLRAHARARLDLWAADQGTLMPMLDDAAALSPTCSNLWLRPNGAAPWEYDVLLMDTAAEQWTFKRNPRIFRPVDEILWHRDGVAYLRPEVQLLHKAAGVRPQDQQDFDACRPLLGGHAAAWLCEALESTHPGHRWIAELT